jgi:hypothetical protein
MTNYNKPLFYKGGNILGFIGAFSLKEKPYNL